MEGSLEEKISIEGRNRTKHFFLYFNLSISWEIIPEQWAQASDDSRSVCRVSVHQPRRNGRPNTRSRSSDNRRRICARELETIKKKKRERRKKIKIVMGEDYRLNKRLRNYSSRTELHRVFRISSLKKLRNWNWLFHSMIPIEGTSERYVDIITAKGKPHRNVINILFCQ